MNLDDPIWTAVFEYSEWLDQHGMLPVEDGDERSHEDLVNGFIKDRGDDA